MNDARTRDRTPTNTELRRIVGLMNLQGKALYPLLATSGIRIGEVLKLHVSDT